ncbi:MAG: UvrD-helicase domain-containing protein, partial [Thermomicrobiales bacterium]|nr:UvrD-helicase domain-containing protein [Thermomicrobiales bacterium]
QGAARAIEARALQRMLAARFDIALIDEYQDCSQSQHDLVNLIAKAVPTCVLGDRLQGIFGFGAETLVDWDSTVLPSFPSVNLQHRPWRWEKTNPELGEWLTAIRPALFAGGPISIPHKTIKGVNWVYNDHQAVNNQANLHLKHNESIVIIGQSTAQFSKPAVRLRGQYTIMEELQGHFMEDFLKIVDGSEPGAIAKAAAKFAKDCHSGLADLDDTILKKLENGQSVAHLKRKGLDSVLWNLSRILIEPSPSTVKDALDAVAKVPFIHLYRREAWRDTGKALVIAARHDDISSQQALGQVRDRLRRRGRNEELRVFSRTVLIKGLEYDHAVIMNADRLNAQNLYVALTRARRSLTVICPESTLQCHPFSIRKPTTARSKSR